MFNTLFANVRNLSNCMFSYVTMTVTPTPAAWKIDVDTPEIHQGECSASELRERGTRLLLPHHRKFVSVYRLLTLPLQVFLSL